MQIKFSFRILLSFVVAFIVCCSNDKTTAENILSNPTDSSSSSLIHVALRYPKSKKVFTYSVTQKSAGKHSLTIETQLLYDSVFLNEGYFRGGNQVVMSQKLVFRQQDSILNVTSMPLQELSQFTGMINNRQIKLPKYVFTGVNIKEENSEIIYILYAWELLNGSREIYIYYDKNGKLIYMANCKENSCIETGSLLDISSKIGITSRTKTSYWQIFPPQYAGQME